nr:hypothetical protein [Bacteroidota bacterium]
VLDKQLYHLAAYFLKDNFAVALTGNVHADSNAEFTITPRLGKFEIFIGDTSNLEDKFARLQAFYRKSLPLEGWNTYKRLNLKYKNQIIANR